MDFLYLTIPVTLVLAILGLKVFLWAAKSGQFEDVEGPKYRMLFEDEEDTTKTKKK